MHTHLSTPHPTSDGSLHLPARLAQDAHSMMFYHRIIEFWDDDDDDDNDDDDDDLLTK